MQIYLVGGAVRDQLLGLPVTERDWVVVGTTPEHMQSLGYQQVGKDFPVFLHPHTKEEYALARTERKTGRGYTGFIADASSSVTLEQDLLRRDFTINAMAMTEQGDLIDPYGGERDLRNGYFRHVSAAFSEDPLRVLRGARFACRFADFSFANETLALMKAIVAAGELAYLVAERIWKEWSRAIMERKPSHFFQVLKDCGGLAVLFPEIENLFGVPQPVAHHPEIDTGVHTLMALDHAAEQNFDLATRIAVLMHDLGKGLTPKAQWPSHHGHEELGVPVVLALTQRYRVPSELTTLAQWVCEYHTHVHRALSLKPQTILKILNKLDYWRRPERLATVLNACLADCRGRLNFEKAPYPQFEFLSQAAMVAAKVQVAAHIEPGMTGEQIKTLTQRLRLAAIRQFVNVFVEDK